VLEVTDKTRAKFHRPCLIRFHNSLVEANRKQHDCPRFRLAAKFRAVTRRSWQLKQPGRHRGVITRTAAEVFLALVYLAEKYHRVFPSLEGLRHLAMCCRQSVVTARGLGKARLYHPHPANTPRDDAARLHYAADHQRLRSARAAQRPRPAGNGPVCY
jgi:hypothetical protein